MTIGILKERNSETRVALMPENVKAFVRLKTELLVEPGAGQNSYAHDQEFEQAGAKLISRSEIMSSADCILTVDAINADEVSGMGKVKILVGALNPFINKSLVDQLVTHRITSFSLELLPRISLAQSMDILSSMATVSGYKAVLDAAGYLPRFFPMFMTAAGTIKPAKVLILGAGVAGLQALATSRRLGAVVEVFDVRTVVKEEVLSLGGKFIEVEGSREDVSAGGYAVEQNESYLIKQGELIHEHAAKADVIICTAQIPGKRAPLLLRSDTVEAMAPGSVIVDLAASSGGNCELTKNNEIIRHQDVTIIGRSHYPALMPLDASRMFGNNLFNFTRLLINTEGGINLNWEDEILKNTCLTHDGKLLNERVLAYYNT